MAEMVPPLFLQNVATTNADDVRSLIEALVPTEGIIAAGHLAVTQNGTPNMSVNVAAGLAVIDGDNTPSTQGSYLVKNDATKNLTVTAADPTNPRKDIVIAEVRDSFYAGADDDWRLRVVAGTPAGSPSEPALPDNAIKLAVIAVAAAATSITNAVITDSRTLAEAFSQFPDEQWTDYTPTLKQDVTVITKTVFYSRYQRTGRMITFEGSLNVTSAGDNNETVTVSLPVTAEQDNQTVGIGSIYNASSTERNCGIALTDDGGTTICFLPAAVNTHNVRLGNANSGFTIFASGDTIDWAITYEAAS